MSSLYQSHLLPQESLQLYRELGDLSSIASVLFTLVRFTIWNGDSSSPVPWLEEGLTICRQLGDQSLEAYGFVTSGGTHYWRGDYQEAIAQYKQAYHLGESSGDHFQQLWAHIHMAYAVLRQGELQRARELLEGNIQRSQKAGMTIGLVYTIEGLASLYTRQEQSERALQLFAWADAMRDQLGDHRPPVEQGSVEHDLSVLRSQLDDLTFERLWNEGGGLTQEQAIVLALSNPQ